MFTVGTYNNTFIWDNDYYGIPYMKSKKLHMLLPGKYDYIEDEKI